MKIMIMLTLLHTLPFLGISQMQTSNTLIRSSTAFKREIPKLKNGKPPGYYLNKRKVEQMIGLQSLENGFDSLEIRIWYAYARIDSAQLVILSRKEKKWSAQLYNFKYIINDNSKKIETINKNRSMSSPKSGWKHFTETFFKLSIDTLPDQNKIKNYPEYTDGNSVIVEVATKNSYRIYSYKEPIQAQTQIEDARKIEHVLTLIEDQFDFYQIRKF